jgi:hypothetical protein
VCAERGADLIELETMLDHVHLLVGVDPSTASTGSSSRSRVGCLDCCATSSPGSSDGCRRYGRTRTSSPETQANQIAAWNLASIHRGGDVEDRIDQNFRDWNIFGSTFGDCLTRGRAESHFE